MLHIHEFDGAFDVREEGEGGNGGRCAVESDERSGGGNVPPRFARGDTKRYHVAKRGRGKRPTPKEN